MMAGATIQKVILSADGDSRSIDFWSNIPFLLATELERRGIEVVRLNLVQPRWIKCLWRYSLGPRHKLRHWHTSIDFYRSRTNHWLTTRLLNRAVRRHGGPGTALINLSISSAPTRRDMPVLLLSDWSYHHYITSRLGREPDRSERSTIRRDSAAMVRASLVVLLFPESAARLQRQIPAGHFRFLGHVINDHPEAPPPPAAPPAATPHRPCRLLFIGRPRYREGLERLLAALQLLPAAPAVQLDVIGIGAEDVAAFPVGAHAISLHGYLSKADPAERQRYYTLLNQADLIINASEVWGGVSATVEAMHRFTAVLTPPYSELTALFGDPMTFGAYLSELRPEALAGAITALLASVETLTAQQQAAHAAVALFTWSAFVDRLFAEIAEIPEAHALGLRC